ncbi:MAG TPA: nitrate- and nitrite sensing domain-containing protein [Natronosporangium sp.]
MTVQDGLNVLYVSTVDREVGRPTNILVAALQQERRTSVAALSAGPEVAAQLELVRAGTDEVLTGWHQQVSSTSVDFAASERLQERIAAAAEQLARLDELRAQVDEGSASYLDVQAAYTEMIEACFAIYAAVSSIDDQEIARQSRTLVSLTLARETLSQQDALLAGVLTQGGFSGRDAAEFLRLVGTQRSLYETAASELPPAEAADYAAFAESAPMIELRRIEDQLIDDAVSRPDNPTVTAEQWQQTIEPAMGAIFAMELAAADRTLARANTARTWVIVRLVLAGGLGLIAVITAIIMSITTARALVRQLERLRDAARDLAHTRLPRVVQRLSAGETVDVAAEAPPLRFGDDEIGQVGQAFNAVQETAVRAAVQQAELRHGVRDVFLSLARRTQNLVHRQLSVVDAMERRETDADEMEDLYRIDHLATRMRRNAENLIVLAGSSPGRVWRRPVPMIDVVRGAIAEVEDYQRVNLLPVQSGALEGRVAGDVIHLLAELIENSASFSPPYAKVSVGGQRVAHGFVVEIEDRGLGMTEADLAAVNQKLAEPPDFSLVDTSRLGHYVVAKLAQRHGIRVHLRTSPYGGVTAIVLIPKEIMLEAVDEEPAAGEPVPAVPAPRPPDGGAAAEGSAGSAAPVMLAGRPDPASAPSTGPQTAAGAPPAGMPSAGTPVAGSQPGSPNEHTAEQAQVRTPSGLPWRVRQASLPRQLLQEDDLDDEPIARDPEQVRRAMHSFQVGTQRGRSDAADSES